MEPAGAQVPCVHSRDVWAQREQLLCGRSLWAPVDLKKQPYWYLLWKKKRKTSLCSYWASETLFLLLCVAVFWMCSFETASVHLPLHLIWTKADRGARLQVGKMGAGEWVWVPGPSLLAASFPHPTPMTTGKKCVLGGVGHWSTWWVVSEEKPQRWAPFCTMEGNFTLASLLQI